MSAFNISVSPRLLCRICHQQSPDKELIEPCNCQGSIGRVHRTCIEKWLTISKRNKCELCGLSFACRLEAPQLMQVMISIIDNNDNGLFIIFSFFKYSVLKRLSTSTDG